MDEIYADSALTIVACAGTDPQYGLPGVTRLRRELPSILVEGPWYLQALPMVNDIHTSLWASRGWTYQEALLAQRKLYFTDFQLYFEGAHSVQCEWATRSTNKPTEDAPWILSQVDYLGNPDRIYDCINSYSRRKVTFESDALNAMLGIFAVFQRRHQVRHMWGMPYMSTHEGVDAGRKARLPSLWVSLSFTNSGRVRRKAYPSWSWLGWSVQLSRSVELLWSSDYDWSQNGAAFVLNIWPELVSGSVISWSDFEKNYEGQTRHADPPSRFIHVQAYMSPIISCFGTSLESADGTTLQILDDEGRSKERIERRAEKFLLIHIPLHWHDEAQHLLVEDLGDHWERVQLLSTSCLDNWECNKKSEEERAEGCNNCRFHYRRNPVGTLRTIRLG